MLFTFYLFLFPITAQYRFDSFTTDNGLPQNGVRGIAQTPDGYLWLTTFDGLVRFDGVNFTVFDKNSSPGITSNRFINLHVEPDGSLFAGTEEGGLTVYRGGRFKTYTVDDGLPSDKILYFHEDSHGKFYIATDRGNCYFRDGAFVPVEPEESLNGRNSYTGPTGNFWTYSKSGIKELMPDGHEVLYPIEISYHSETLSGVNFFEDSKGNAWFGDLSGVYRLKDGSATKLTAQDGVPQNTILRPFVEDADGGIWFATGWFGIPGIGMVRFYDGKFSVWGTEAGLSNLSVSLLFKDREGSIWAATDRGVNRLRRQLIRSYSVSDGLVHTEVYPLLQTKNGDIYIGTTKGISRFRDGKFTELDVKTALGDKISATAFFEDAKGRLWIGAVGGLYRFEDGKLTNLTEFFKITVWAIQADRSGDIWVGTGNGLFEFHDDEIVAKYTTAEGLPSNDVKVIHEDRDGALWFGTYGGLFRLDKNAGRSVFTTADGLASDQVRSIYEDAQGTLWIGTYDGGLSRFSGGKFFNYTVGNGLFNNGVFQIFEDDNGNFWISCNRGIYRVAKRELEDLADGKITKINCVAYGKQDGMLNTESNGGRQPAGIRAADGSFWFPTQDGVTVVDPKVVSINPSAPPVRIESVFIDRQAAEFGDGISLQANENNLEVRYTGISFVKPEQIKFRYRIEGLSEDWTDVGSIREVYFPSLPAGDYLFHVIAANSDGIWNPDGAVLNIKVNAPFWKRGWFIALASLIVLVVIVLIFRLRERELKRRQLVQQEFSSRLLESQEQERKRIASEMHDSLGQYLLAIKNWAMFGLNSIPEGDAAREYLTEVSDTSTLAIEEVREIAHNLRPYQLERLGLTNTLEYMLKNLKSSSAIVIEYEIDNIDGVLSKNDEIVFYRIVQECASNVIKHSDAKNAWLTVKLMGEMVEFVCRDDGRGFDFDAAKNSSKSGLGLNGIIERVKILKGDLRVESEVGAGTKTTIEVEKNRE